MVKDSSSQSQHTDSSGRLLARAGDRMLQILSRKLDRYGLTPGEWLVMCELLEAGRMMPSTLAERLSMSRGGISRLVDRMVERDLIERTGDTLDRRAHWLSVSSAGQEMLPAIRKAVSEGEEAFFEPLHPSEERSLRQLLAKLCGSAS